ncbi:MAG TPA: PDZ domain-containing protein [Pyrinomonadaceae bacterium]|jgi:serine protease Do|nr:PDZ domain-containing protein [Pyrinomonadaceae bacterium]
MKVKHPIRLLSAIILSAGMALAQQPAPPPPAPPDEPLDQNFSFFIDGGGFLGVYAENISRENMGRYRLSQVRGVGVTQVIKDSPAEKAGLRKDDVILRLDGENVTSVRKLNRLVSELSPDQSVKVVISRGGSEQEVTATIGKRNNPNMAQDFLGGAPRIFKWEGPDLKNFKWEAPLFNRNNFPNEGDLSFFLTNGRRIGVSTMSLTKQLADYFGIADGKGALVTSVAEDGPAARAGVKAGDVITAVDGETVDSPGDISRVINRKKEGDVTLTIIRNKSQQTIRVSPREGTTSGASGQPQIGRRIVIPRIEIPTMPDIDIAMPNIVIPSIPTINIQMPRIRVTPRIRVRGSQGPI